MKKLLRLRVEHYDWTVNPRVDYDQIGHLQFSGKFVGDKDADILADVSPMLEAMQGKYRIWYKENKRRREAVSRLPELETKLAGLKAQWDTIEAKWDLYCRTISTLYCWLPYPDNDGVPFMTADGWDETSPHAVESKTSYAKARTASKKVWAIQARLDALSGEYNRMASIKRNLHSTEAAVLTLRRAAKPTARESDYERVMYDVYPNNPASVLAALIGYDYNMLQRHVPMWASVGNRGYDVGYTVADSTPEGADGVWWVGSEVMAGKRRTKANEEWLKAIADGEMREYCAWANNDAVYLWVEVADTALGEDTDATAPCWVGYEDMYPTAWIEDDAGVSGGPWYGDNAVSDMVSDLVDVYPLTPAQVLWLNMHLDAYPADSGEWVYLLHEEITQ